jgi:D-aminopeptidase
LFSTIGERQVNEFEVMVDLLLESEVPVILLVNDDLLPSENEKIITRTGVELIKKFQ